MGNGADKILKVLDEYGISVKGIFASDGFVREKLFHGMKVESYDSLKERYPQMIVLLCFGSSRPEVIENVFKIAKEQELYAPDVPVIDGGLFNLEYARKNILELENIYNLLADDTSKKTFRNIIEYKLTGKINLLFECQVDYDEPFENILDLKGKQFFLDLGAYNGDTVLDFAKRVPDYKEIIAVEPDKKTFKKLLKNTEKLRDIECVNICVSDYCGTGCFLNKGGRNSSVSKGQGNTYFSTVDNIVGNRNVTYINMDVEGEELKVIGGA